MDISRNDERRPTLAPAASSMLNNKDIEELYLRKLQDLQQRNTELLNITNKQFSTAVKQVEHKFRGFMPQAVCQDLQTEVLKCYQENPGDILNCSSIVNAFTACVNHARIDQTLFHVKEVKLVETLRKIAEDNSSLLQGAEHKE